MARAVIRTRPPKRKTYACTEKFGLPSLLTASPPCGAQAAGGGTLVRVTAVDPDDDRIRRYVLRRYAYDPQRRERRHVVLGAFDNPEELRRLMDQLSSDLERRRAKGEPIDRREHVSGVILEPNHARRQRDGRLLLAAMRHRVTISEEFLERLDLPPNIGLLRFRGRVGEPPPQQGRAWAGGRYRWRTRLRGTLPWFVVRWIPKGSGDCGNHQWYVV